MPEFSSLKLEQLSLAVRLGCTAEERAKAQELRVSFELRFPRPPEGCTSDSLSGTVCFAEIAGAVRRHCESREFHLIESMGMQVYGVVKEMAGRGVIVSVAMHKVKPPVVNLLGGAVFRCGDFAV